MNIKDFLKSTRLYYCYKLRKNHAIAMQSYAAAEKAISSKYLSMVGKNMNWDNPETYTEKLNFSKLYCVTDEKIVLSDKLLVRSWVEEKIGKKYLIPLLGVYDSYDEIDFSELPKSFVIKCNHDSGSVTIVHDKSKLNYKKLKRFYDFCLKRNFAFNTYEMHYKTIKPKIIIEQLMNAEGHNGINDYKFLCFNGKAYYCWVDTDRYVEHKRKIYDTEWNPQPFRQFNYPEEAVEKPNNLDEMVRVVEVLCSGFGHVRVDLYDVDGKIYFGEMTFTNGTGYEKIEPVEWDYKLGKMWNIDLTERKQKNKRGACLIEGE